MALAGKMAQLASSEDLSDSPQYTALAYAVPIMACLASYATPLFLLSRGSSSLREEISAARSKPVSAASLAVFLLSPFLLLSNYMTSTLHKFTVYCLLLAAASLVADRVGKQRCWPSLLILQALNLLNLLGCWSIFELGGNANPGIMTAAFTGGVVHASKIGCPVDALAVPWCVDGWVVMQVVISFVYILLHIVICAVVGMRTAESYGAATCFEAEGKQSQANDKSDKIEA